MEEKMNILSEVEKQLMEEKEEQTIKKERTEMLRPVINY